MQLDSPVSRSKSILLAHLLFYKIQDISMLQFINTSKGVYKLRYVITRVSLQ
jgi:hypothetical protein